MSSPDFLPPEDFGSVGFGYTHITDRVIRERATRQLLTGQHWSVLGPQLFMHPTSEDIPPVEPTADLTYEQAIDRFADVYAIEAEPELKAQFDDIVTKTELACGVPAMYPRIHSVAHKLDWLLFGKKGQALPEGMALSPTAFEDGDKLFYKHADIIDTTTALRSDDEDVIYRGMMNNGLTELQMTVNSLRTGKLKEIEESFGEAVKLTPLMQFFYGFAQSLPQISERSLTLAEKTMRLNAAGHEIRIKHGLANQDNLRLHATASRELGRRAILLDDETMRIVQPVDNEFGSLRAFFENEILEYYGNDPQTLKAELHNFKMGSTAADLERSIVKKILGDNKEHLYDARSAVRLIAIKLGQVQERSDETLTGVLDQVCKDALVFSLGVGVQPYGEIEHIAAARGMLYNLPQVTDTNYDNTLPKIDFSKNKPADVQSPEYYPGYNSQTYEDMPTIVDRYHYEQDLATVLAEVDWLQPLVNRAPRLLGAQPAEMSDSSSVGPAELRVRFTGTRPADIAGYQIVKLDKNTGVAEYAKLDNDPYRPADILINYDAQARLLAAVDDMQVPVLASSLRKSQLSVEQLVRTIADLSDYTFDMNGQQVAGNWGARTLNGRLQMQCTGAAAVLKNLLNAAYPGSAKVISGKVLMPGDDIVSAAGHAQVNFYDARTKQRFYLDATPKFREYRANYAPPTSVASDELLNVLADVTAPTMELALPIEQPTVSLKSQIELLLQPRLGVKSAEAVYEKVAQLAVDDPMSVTVAAVLRSEMGGFSPEWYDDPQRLVSYLDSIAMHDTEYLKQANITAYTPDTLRMLKSFAQRLSQQQKV